MAQPEDDASRRDCRRSSTPSSWPTRWRKGLADTGQTPERIARLQGVVGVAHLHAGSEAGLPLSILGTFAAPKGKMPREALTQKIDATATALLGLTGITSRPGAVARTHPHRPAAAARLDRPARTSTCPA